MISDSQCKTDTSFLQNTIALTFLMNLQVSTRIVKLNLRNNALSSLRGLEYMKSLVDLDLSCNVISSFSELEVLGSLLSLESLWLEGNPICYARWYRAHIFSYLSDPVKVCICSSFFNLFYLCIFYSCLKLNKILYNSFGLLISVNVFQHTNNHVVDSVVGRNFNQCRHQPHTSSDYTC